MDYEDLGPAMRESAAKDRVEELEKRVAQLEQVIERMLGRLNWLSERH